MSRTKKADSFITVIGADAKTNKAVEDAILAKMMRELGIFVEEETRPAKSQKTKRGLK